MAPWVIRFAVQTWSSISRSQAEPGEPPLRDRLGLDPEAVEVDRGLAGFGGGVLQGQFDHLDEPDLPVLGEEPGALGVVGQADVEQRADVPRRIRCQPKAG